MPIWGVLENVQNPLIISDYYSAFLLLIHLGMRSVYSPVHVAAIVN